MLTSHSSRADRTNSARIGGPGLRQHNHSFNTQTSLLTQPGPFQFWENDLALQSTGQTHPDLGQHECPFFSQESEVRPKPAHTPAQTPAMPCHRLAQCHTAVGRASVISSPHRNTSQNQNPHCSQTKLSFHLENPPSAFTV